MASAHREIALVAHWNGRSWSLEREDSERWARPLHRDSSGITARYREVALLALWSRCSMNLEEDVGQAALMREVSLNGLLPLCTVELVIWWERWISALLRRSVLATKFDTAPLEEEISSGNEAEDEG